MCWIMIYIAILMLLTGSLLYLQLQSSDISRKKHVDQDLINLLKVTLNFFSFFLLKYFFIIFYITYPWNKENLHDFILLICCVSTSSQWFTILCFSPGLIYNFQFFDGISICLCICGNRDDGEFLDLWVYGELWTSSSAWCCFSGVMLHRGCRSYKTCQLARSPCNLPLRVYIFNAVYSIYASPKILLVLEIIQEYVGSRMQRKQQGQTDMIVFCDGDSQPSEEFKQTKVEGEYEFLVWSNDFHLQNDSVLICFDVICRRDSLSTYWSSEAVWCNVCSSVCFRST